VLVSRRIKEILRAWEVCQEMLCLKGCHKVYLNHHTTFSRRNTWQFYSSVKHICNSICNNYTLQGIPLEYRPVLYQIQCNLCLGSFRHELARVLKKMLVLTRFIPNEQLVIEKAQAWTYLNRMAHLSLAHDRSTATPLQDRCHDKFKVLTDRSAAKDFTYKA
jgi:hypothetical protein